MLSRGTVVAPIPPLLRGGSATFFNNLCFASTSSAAAASRLSSFSERVKSGPSLKDFLQSGSGHDTATEAEGEEPWLPSSVPSLDANARKSIGEGRSVFVETYGCQMNMSDTEIVLSIMQGAGFGRADSVEEADVIFVNTCAIRDKAEQKVWDRLNYLKSLKRQNKRQKRVVGVLGCMAERLKTRLLESDRLVDLVVGPDAYRSLPSLLMEVEGGQHAMNVQLSIDETYADITPVRSSANQVSAYLSIMRGCNNMCSYCIVPFTRGRERSRPVDSIVEEVRQLSAEGVKEVVLLGQNVNSYNDLSLGPSSYQYHADSRDSISASIDGEDYGEDPDEEEEIEGSSPQRLSRGFSELYKRKEWGVRFVELMDRVSRVDPEMRIRFTSPHPKDFPDDLLYLIRDRPNLCNAIHIPAQSGSTSLLKRMRRNYSRESYLALIERIREIIPGVSLSSDFIAGFCGETEEEHQQTLSLIKEIKYDHAFMFAYSMREKTHAHRKMQDDVPPEVKQRRLKEIVDLFYGIAAEKNTQEVGKRHLVLVEGKSKRSEHELFGRTDTNKKVIIPDVPVSSVYHPPLQQHSNGMVKLNVGDYVVVEVESCTAISLRGVPLARTTLSHFAASNNTVGRR
ncbi:CDK5 regulatory subunit associated protein 1 [Balamuthia mandrillaris]